MKPTANKSPAPPESFRSKALFGCASRRTVWLPTWRGWLLLLIILAGLFWLIVKNVPAFLTVNNPVAADLLVVEGWLPDYALERARVEFQKGTYQKLYVTGVPLEKGRPLAEYKTYAELGAATLIASGMNSNQVAAVPAPEVRADRTFSTASTLKALFEKDKIAGRKLNLISIGPHARRSRLLYEKAFGEDWEIGIISVAERAYDPHHWYRSSNGVRNVLDEAIAYFYARFFFHEASEK